jgi:hypothetical protein
MSMRCAIHLRCSTTCGSYPSRVRRAFSYSASPFIVRRIERDEPTMPTAHPRPLRLSNRPRLWLRRACIVLAGVETVALTGYAGIMVTLAFSSDPLGSAIGRGMVVLTAVPLVGLALPAPVLAILDRWQLMALTLATLVVPVSILLWRLA